MITSICQLLMMAMALLLAALALGEAAMLRKEIRRMNDEDLYTDADCEEEAEDESGT